MLRSSAGVDVPAVRFPFVRELLWRQCRGSGKSFRRFLRNAEGAVKDMAS